MIVIITDGLLKQFGREKKSWHIVLCRVKLWSNFIGKQLSTVLKQIFEKYLLPDPKLL